MGCGDSEDGHRIKRGPCRWNAPSSLARFDSASDANGFNCHEELSCSSREKLKMGFIAGSVQRSVSLLSKCSVISSLSADNLQCEDDGRPLFRQNGVPPTPLTHPLAPTTHTHTSPHPTPTVQNGSYRPVPAKRWLVVETVCPRGEQLVPPPFFLPQPISPFSSHPPSHFPPSLPPSHGFCGWRRPGSAVETLSFPQHHLVLLPSPPPICFCACARVCFLFFFFILFFFFCPLAIALQCTNRKCSVEMGSS